MRTPIRLRMEPASAMITISGTSMISHSHLSVPTGSFGATDLTKIPNMNIGPSSMKFARKT